jgi:hypothetical protein
LQDELYPEVGHFILPGSGYNSQYIMTMAHVAKAIGDPLRQPNFHRYRRIQVYQHLASRDFRVRWSDEESLPIWKGLSFAEKFHAYYVVLVHKLSSWLPQLFRVKSALQRDMSIYDFTPVQYVLNEGDYLKGSEVFADICSGKIRFGSAA